MKVTKHTLVLSLFALCAAALAAGSPQAPATHPGSHSGTQAGTPSDRDRQAADPAANPGAGKDATFMKDAAADGMAEVELGRLASSKATRPEVKEFAQMLVSDHSKANDELKELAARKSVTLPAEPGAQHKAEMARLEKLSGAAFDEAYAKAMAKDHQKAVSLFSKQASAGSDPDVKQWAEQTLPKLKEHLAKAAELAGEKGASGKGASGTRD